MIYIYGLHLHLMVCIQLVMVFFCMASCWGERLRALWLGQWDLCALVVWSLGLVGLWILDFYRWWKALAFSCGWSSSFGLGRDGVLVDSWPRSWIGFNRGFKGAFLVLLKIWECLEFAGSLGLRRPNCFRNVQRYRVSDVSLGDLDLFGVLFACYWDDLDLLGCQRWLRCWPVTTWWGIAFDRVIVVNLDKRLTVVLGVKREGTFFFVFPFIRPPKRIQLRQFP